MAGPGTSPKKLDAQEFATAYKHTLFHALDSIDLGNVGKAIEILAEARAKSRTVFLFGNGGSASTASHFSVDLSKGASFQRESRFRGPSLTDSLPTITANCQHAVYKSVSGERPKAPARPGDVLP